ncbi:hypothetical protein [Paractinoplanes atraurantiacus]|uniref:Uncharacterized protein n=1 Tax=Paractinoplanes atraurantiacus TaxID=1036182 RepID=A0A285F314_9ACTN|nr:hypothetical protein [Actinoplanes atraurantiacus]SNY05710.1 hypothetical protein SAMN05421748_101534 [Actinoplanes atraurantiacus]
MTVTGEDSVIGSDPLEPPLSAPLRRDLGWQQVLRMAQSADHLDDALLRQIRSTAAIHRGTRMTKVLSPAQVSGHLGGWLPYGFCYRSCDIAHLHDPRDLALLRTDGTADDEVAFALRWRATDPIDYEVPAGPAQPGLSMLPAHSRVGAMVLGTGFTPSNDDLVPEYITAGFADLPMPANAQIIAYVPGGEEVLLYTYQPEQHGWLRLAGPRWRGLLDNLPGVSPDREYVPCTTPGSAKLVGTIKDREYEAVADPPSEFRVRALTRAARYPVSTLSRRAEQALWRGVPCWVLQRDDAWARLRLVRPDADALSHTGARCYERGVYEAWAPVGELMDHHIADIPYEI